MEVFLGVQAGMTGTRLHCLCMSGVVKGFDQAYSTTCRLSIKGDDQDTPSAHTEECTVNLSQLRVMDGCYAPPTRTARFRLDDSTSGILTIIGLLVALPSLFLGAYRWYRARRAMREAQIEDGQVVPLVPVGHSGGVAVSNLEPRRQELARLGG